MGLIGLISEVSWLYNPVKQAERGKRLKELSPEVKDKKWDQYPQEYKDIIKSYFTAIPLMLYTILGIFTFQWEVFLVVILFNMLIMYPLNRLTAFNWLYIVFNWINSLIGSIFIVFTIINAYQLHINFLPILKSLF